MDAFHVPVIVVVVAMVNLAFWQLRRLHERRETWVRANSLSRSSHSTTCALTSTSTCPWNGDGSTPPAPVPGHQFLVVNRSQEGELGQNVVDAQLDDGSLMLVNRGFVAQEDPVPDAGGHRSSCGPLRNSERRRTGQPADIGTDQLTEIRRVDIDVLRQQFDASVLPMYIEQLDSTPADASSLEPIVAPALDEGPHLSYTIQWFIFSVCVLVGWVLAVRRSAAIRSGKPAKRRKSAYIPIAEDQSVR